MNYRALMSTAAILIVPIAAIAQEQRGSVDWSGYYAGVFGGTAQFDAERRSQNSVTSFSGNGSIQGMVAGYNVQQNDWFYGIEADIATLNWTQEDLNDVTPGPAEAIDATAAASLRGRFGFVHDRTLLFASAGIGRVDRQFIDGSGGELDLSGTGPVAGLGVEHRLEKNITVGLEGLVFFLDESADEVTLGSFSADATTELNAGNVGIIRARVTYSW
jgi:opacity protein-like surface antigen